MFTHCGIKLHPLKQLISRRRTEFLRNWYDSQIKRVGGYPSRSITTALWTKFEIA